MGSQVERGKLKFVSQFLSHSSKSLTANDVELHVRKLKITSAVAVIHIFTVLYDEARDKFRNQQNCDPYDTM